MKKVSTKTIGTGLLISLIVYIVFLALFGDSLVTWSAGQHVLVQLLVYYSTQAQFVLILIGTTVFGAFWKYSKSALKGFAAGLILDFATDIISTPRCVLQSGFVQNAAPLKVCSDTIFVGFFNSVLPFSAAYYLYYLVLPIVFAFIAFELLGVSRFTAYLLGKAKK